jgi:thiol:disulfide interchange protein DsbD
MRLTRRLSLAALAVLLLIAAAWAAMGRFTAPAEAVAAAAPAVRQSPPTKDIRVHWSIARVDSGVIAAGKTISIAMNAQIDEGWHVFGLVEPPGPIATSFTIPAGGPFTINGDIGAPTPTRKFDVSFNAETAFYEGHTAFTVPVKIAEGTTGKQTLTIEVLYQTCNDRLCMPPRTEKYGVEFTIGGTTTSAVVRGAEGAGVPGAEVPGATGSGTGTANVVDMSASTGASTLSAFVGLAALMGALSLLTPCVFPMVPITVSFFTNRASKNRREAVTQALVYGAGIILTFTGVGFALAVTFGAAGLNRFAADPWLNLGVTALFLFFAMSLFGVYELALPSSMLTAASKADSGKGRYVGTILMGFAFTLTSFTCTAPFLGTLLVLASQGQWQWPLAGMLAFSSVFALPFIILALAPQLISSLPRAGSWLMSVKATMGLLELAAAFKFLSNADLVWHWGIFTRTNVLIAWVIIAAVLVAYLLGAFKLGHAPRLKRPGMMRLATAAFCAIIVVWLGRGVAGQRLGELEAFLPPADLSGAAAGGELSWIMNDYDAGLAQAKKEGRPMLVDFTGYTCTNCRWMEANMFPRPDVSLELARYVRVRLYTDGKGEMYQRYQNLEQQLFGTVALPYYAVFNSDGKPVVAFGGLTRKPEEYIAFLRKGLE